MREYGVQHLPVVEDGTVGMLHFDDALRRAEVLLGSGSASKRGI
jgi:hypothetical protein